MKKHSWDFTSTATLPQHFQAALSASDFDLVAEGPEPGWVVMKRLVVLLLPSYVPPLAPGTGLASPETAPQRGGGEAGECPSPSLDFASMSLKCYV